jgi:Vibrio phage DNA polymerase
LLDAIHSADDPIYCDTDSLLCRNLGGVDLHPSRLGAWDCEGEFDQIAICGKKLYMCRNTDTGASKSAHKGFPALDWNEYLAMLNGDEIITRAKGITIYKDGSQGYVTRTARVTTPQRKAA